MQKSWRAVKVWSKHPYSTRERTVMETISGEVHRPSYHHSNDSGRFVHWNFILRVFRTQ